MRHKFRLKKFEYKQRAVLYPGAVQMPTKRRVRVRDHEARARMLEAVREVLGRDVQRPTD